MNEYYANKEAQAIIEKKQLESVVADHAAWKMLYRVGKRLEERAETILADIMNAE
jgi:hypothetical protein